MAYLRVPDRITYADIYTGEVSWSPSMYQRVIIPNGRTKRVADLLDPESPFDKGVEPGSMWYLKKSTHYFIRTKALQPYSCLIYPKGGAIMPINARVFKDADLQDRDILVCKDSNIGECVMLCDPYLQNHMLSAGIIRLRPSFDRYYLFAFLKHPLFKTQLMAKSARGSTIRHAKERWLDCLIPFPDQKDAELIIDHLSMLMQAIVEKEIAIKERATTIRDLIQRELMENQRNSRFAFTYPCIEEVGNVARLDAAIYSEEYKSKISLVDNYRYGYLTPGEDGFTVIPGPSLEIKVLRTRIDYDSYRQGFYALILPTNISEYGTMNAIPYLGTAKKLPILRRGDIVFGEAGFQKGRSIVLVEGVENYTTNAHGIYARREDGNIRKSIFFRCIFDWYRNMRLIDLMGVGGSGGHFSPEYFDYLHIPKFPEEKREEIIQLYHNHAASAANPPTTDNLADWHRLRNTSLGIWELDRDIKGLRRTLTNMQELIVEGKTVKITT